MTPEAKMKTAAVRVLAVTLFAAASAHSAGRAASVKAAEAAAGGRPVRLVDLAGDSAGAKAARLFAAAAKECQCSEWKTVYTEECVAWDSKGNCSKTQTVKRRECVAWDHCH